MSMDILHLSVNPETGRPLFSERDINDTQIIMIDDQEGRLYFELWKPLAERPIQRLGKIKNKRAIHLKNVVIPLAGGTNPMWQDHWASVDCTESQTLSVFADRIYKQLSIAGERDPKTQLVPTFINRKESRSLKDQEKLFSDLRDWFPYFHVNVVDFVSLKFWDQVTLVQKTDILVGISGAGLSHSLFLKPRSCLVKIMSEDVDMKAFRNAAKLRDLQYFSVHAPQEQTQEHEKGH